MRPSAAILLPILIVAACRSQAPQPQNTNVVNVTVAAQQEVTTPPAPEQNMARAAKAPALDPKSAPAALAVVRNFTSALDQRRFNEAFAMQASGISHAQFVKQFEGFKSIQTDVGQPTGTEGAAGSVYMTVPLTVSGTKTDGSQHTMTGSAILRRVNDVPGSTEEQRRWHIQRIDWKAAS